MSNKYKLGLVLFFVILALLFFWYSQNSKNQVALSNKVQELNSLIGVNCPKVIDEATKYLKTNSGAEQIWNALGACQFDAGKFADAKISFQKVLSLNSNSQSAKNYLEDIKMATADAVVAMTGPATQLSQPELESAIGLKLGSGLQFAGADKRTASDKSIHLSAIYISNQGPENTLSFLKNKFTEAGAVFRIQKVNNAGVFFINSKTTQLTLTVIFDNKNKLTQIIVKYLKLNE